MILDNEFIEYQSAHRRMARTRDELFYLSSLFPGTPMGIRAELLLRVPHVLEVAIVPVAPGRVDVHVELPAWSWALLGVLHLLTWLRIVRQLERSSVLPSGVRARIRIGLPRTLSDAAASRPRPRATPSPLIAEANNSAR